MFTSTGEVKPVFCSRPVGIRLRTAPLPCGRSARAPEMNLIKVSALEVLLATCAAASLQPSGCTEWTPWQQPHNLRLTGWWTPVVERRNRLKKLSTRFVLKPGPMTQASACRTRMANGCRCPGRAQAPCSSDTTTARLVTVRATMSSA